MSMLKSDCLNSSLLPNRYVILDDLFKFSVLPFSRGKKMGNLYNLYHLLVKIGLKYVMWID